MKLIHTKKLEKFADDHYKYITPLISFHGIKKSYWYLNSTNHKMFIDYIETNLKSIIIDKPIILRKHTKVLTGFHIQLTKHRKSKKQFSPDKQRDNEFINELKKVFDYDKKIDKVGHAKKIGLISCPYCNREYIFKFTDNEKERTEIRLIAHLDHYYDKATYPFLALSFYNLIPSCYICNSKFKGKTDFLNQPHLHPYEDDFNSRAKFTQSFAIVTKKNQHFGLLSKERINLELNPLEVNDKKTENTIATFRLRDLYNEHKDIVLEIIRKREIYTDSYVEELLGKYEGTLFKNREDLLRHITCGYMSDEDIDKRPLSKLIKDISEELGF